MGNNSSSAGYSRLPPPPSDSDTQPLLADYTDNIKNAIHSVNTNFSPQERSLMQPVKSRNSNLTTESQVNALERRLAKLEPLLYEVKKQEEQIQKIKQKNAALEKQVLELLAIIDESKNKVNVRNGVRNERDNISSSSVFNLIDMDYEVPTTATTIPSNNLTVVPQSSELDAIKNPFNRKVLSTLDSEANCSLLNDLIGCVMVVIFLVTFIIGLLL